MSILCLAYSAEKVRKAHIMVQFLSCEVRFHFGKHILPILKCNAKYYLLHSLWSYLNQIKKGARVPYRFA